MMNKSVNYTLGLCAGGTGGHVYPALAVAREWERRGGKVVFFLTGRGTEEAVLKQSNAKYYIIRAGQFAGKGLIDKIKAFFNIIRGLFQAKKIFKQGNIDAVIGFGGYASFPVILAAFFSRIPGFIFEANAVLGMANTVLSLFSKVIFLNFEGVKVPVNKEILISGLPVREEFLKIEDRINPSGNTILIIGGSQGSATLNKYVPESLKILHKRGLKFRGIHQCGKGKISEVKKEYDGCGFDVSIVEFIENMAEHLSMADIVISRSGAGILSELSTVGVPSVLVPFPYASKNHQLANAEYFENEGASIVVTEGEGLSERIAEATGRLLMDESLRMRMREAMRKMSRKDSANKVVDKILEIIERRKS